MKDPLLRTLYIAAGALLIGLVAWRLAERRITGANRPISALSESPAASPSPVFTDDPNDPPNMADSFPNAPSLNITDSMIDALVKLRAEPKAFGTTENAEILERSVNRLLERLITSTREHRSTLWVFDRYAEEMQSVRAILDADTFADKQYKAYLRRIIVTLGIADADSSTTN